LLLSVSCTEVNFCVAISTSTAFSYPLVTPAVVILSLQSGGVAGEPLSVTAAVISPAEGRQGAQTPTGTVEFTDGTVIGSATLNGSDGFASATGTITVDEAGSQEVTATYEGDGYFQSSPTASPTPLLVEEATSSTYFGFGSGSSVYYGDEGSFTVDVKPEYPSTEPTGTVTMSTQDGLQLCDAAVTSGVGACSVAPHALGPGTYAVVATYGGDDGLEGSSSATAILSVRPDPTSTLLSSSTGAVTYGNEDIERLSVKVQPVFAGSVHGVVTVLAGRHKLCTIDLLSRSGFCDLAQKALSPGSHRLDATYRSNGLFGASVSASTSIKVLRPRP
jgi:hypothetical protein